MADKPKPASKPAGGSGSGKRMQEGKAGTTGGAKSTTGRKAGTGGRKAGNAGTGGTSR